MTSQEQAIRVVFMGTSQFAVPALEMLHAQPGIEIVAVYTAPDAASGRGKKLLPSPVKAVALELGLSIHTSATLRDQNERDTLASLRPDIIVVTSYGFILPKDILEIPVHGCINIHASLLPRWRGAAPIQRALLAGDSELGVSIMRMDEGLDTGAYCAQAHLAVSREETSDDIEMELARLGARLLLETLPAIFEDTALWVEQGEENVTYAEKIEKQEMLLAPELDAHSLMNRILASSDRAPARLSVKDKDVRVHAARVVPVTGSSDSSLSDTSRYQGLPAGHLRFAHEQVIVSGSDPDRYVLVISELKPAGKQRMSAFSWAHGMQLEGDILWQ